MMIGASGEDPTARPTALLVDHLTNCFGERIASEDVSFSVAAGEVVGFLGPPAGQILRIGGSDDG